MLGIAIRDFYDMSPKEFYYALKTKWELIEQDMEYNRKLQHVVARYQAAIILTPHIKNPIKDARELGAFSWEEVPVQSMDQMKQFLQGMARSANKKFKKKEKHGTSNTR